MTWIDALPNKRRRGSYPRCLLLTDGTPQEVSDRLTRMVNLSNVHVSPTDFWMPKGRPIKQKDGASDLSPTREAKLTEVQGFLPPRERDLLRKWWLAAPNRANVPNWDIASTCSIDEKRGLILVEAKANHEELKAAGKTLDRGASPNSQKNHAQIGNAIEEAKNGLSQIPGHQWGISRDTHYQLSNRFAWAWKIASLRIPVVLVYLGFTNAIDLEAAGLTAFKDGAEWEDWVLLYSTGLVSPNAWLQTIMITNVPLIPIIRSI